MVVKDKMIRDNVIVWVFAVALLVVYVFGITVALTCT
jgi:hypothetical protein